jgi:hypothetical protein
LPSRHARCDEHVPQPFDANAIASRRASDAADVWRRGQHQQVHDGADAGRDGTAEGGNVGAANAVKHMEPAADAEQHANARRSVRTWRWLSELHV